jgi:antitoxin MazE
MKTHVQRWGNSLALRIPKMMAVELGVGPETAVELELIDGTLIVRVATDEPTLDQLLADVNANNLHNEIDTGRPLGGEVW